MALVEKSNEGGLREGVLKGKEFVFGDSVGAGLEDRPGANGTQVVTLRGAKQW